MTERQAQNRQRINAIVNASREQNARRDPLFGLSGGVVPRPAWEGVAAQPPIPLRNRETPNPLHGLSERQITRMQGAELARQAGERAAENYSPLSDDLGLVLPPLVLAGDLAAGAGDFLTGHENPDRARRQRLGVEQMGYDLVSDDGNFLKALDGVGAAMDAEAETRRGQGLPELSPIDHLVRFWRSPAVAERDMRARAAEAEARAEFERFQRARDEEDGFATFDWGERVARNDAMRAYGDMAGSAALTPLELVPGVGVAPDLFNLGRATARNAVRLAGYEVPTALRAPAQASRGLLTDQGRQFVNETATAGGAGALGAFGADMAMDRAGIDGGPSDYVAPLAGVGLGAVAARALPRTREFAGDIANDVRATINDNPVLRDYVVPWNQGWWGGRALGVAGGGAAGALLSDEEDWQGRLADAAKGAGIGWLAGAPIGAVAATAPRAIRDLSRLGDNALRAIPFEDPPIRDVEFALTEQAPELTARLAGENLVDENVLANLPRMDDGRARIRTPEDRAAFAREGMIHDVAENGTHGYYFNADNGSRYGVEIIEPRGRPGDAVVQFRDQSQAGQNPLALMENDYKRVGGRSPAAALQNLERVMAAVDEHAAVRAPARIILPPADEGLWLIYKRLATPDPNTGLSRMRAPPGYRPIIDEESRAIVLERTASAPPPRAPRVREMGADRDVPQALRDMPLLEAGLLVGGGAIAGDMLLDQEAEAAGAPGSGGPRLGAALGALAGVGAARLGGKRRMLAAIRDPQTGRVFSGANHAEALANAPASIQPRLEALYAQNGADVGFMRGDEFLSREQAMETLGDSALGRGTQTSINAPEQQIDNAAGTEADIWAALPTNPEQWREAVDLHPWFRGASGPIPSRAQAVIMASARDETGRFIYSTPDILNATGIASEGSLAVTLAKARAAGVPVPSRGGGIGGATRAVGGNLTARVLQVGERALKAGSPMTLTEIANAIGGITPADVRVLLHTAARPTRGRNVTPEIMRRARDILNANPNARKRIDPLAGIGIAALAGGGAALAAGDADAQDVGGGQIAVDGFILEPGEDFPSLSGAIDTRTYGDMMIVEYADGERYAFRVDRSGERGAIEPLGRVAGIYEQPEAEETPLPPIVGTFETPLRRDPEEPPEPPAEHGANALERGGLALLAGLAASRGSRVLGANRIEQGLVGSGMAFGADYAMSRDPLEALGAGAGSALSGVGLDMIENYRPPSRYLRGSPSEAQFNERVRGFAMTLPDQAPRESVLRLDPTTGEVFESPGEWASGRLSPRSEFLDAPPEEQLAWMDRIGFETPRAPSTPDTGSIGVTQSGRTLDDVAPLPALPPPTPAPDNIAPMPRSFRATPEDIMANPERGTLASPARAANALATLAQEFGVEVARGARGGVNAKRTAANLATAARDNPALQAELRRRGLWAVVLGVGASAGAADSPIDGVGL